MDGNGEREKHALFSVQRGVGNFDTLHFAKADTPNCGGMGNFVCAASTVRVNSTFYSFKKTEL